ncbi:hypothetical protein P5673_009808, partial [Acropora cervicornis]
VKQFSFSFSQGASLLPFGSANKNAQNIGVVDTERTRVLMFLASVPGSQSVTLEKKLKQAKAQPERKATKPAKRKDHQ